MKNKNVIAVRNLLRCLDLESLKAHEVIANLIRAFGIVQWGAPAFGLDEDFKNPSTDWAGIYQTPDQLAKALVYLSQFKIESYCEIGVFQGGNFMFVSEYLKRFNPEIKCIGIDPTNYMNIEIRYLIAAEDWMELSQVTSDPFRGRKFDLVFIDGEHSGGWVERDWKNLGQFAKICMFHDIQEVGCPEVVDFWAKLDRKGKKTAEFLDHTSENPSQGIGIIHNKTKEAS